MKLFSISLVAVLMMFSSQAVWAISASAPQVIVSADVVAELELEVIAIDEKTQSPMSSLDFGELLRTDSELLSPRVCRVMLKVSGTGQPLELIQTASELVVQGNSDIIPKGAFMMRPAYLPEDNAGIGMPAGSQVAAPGPVYGRQLLYRDPTGSHRIISVYYTLSGDPTTGATDQIPLTQKEGNYFGNIQYTLTTI